MIPTFKEYNDNPPPQLTPEQQAIIDEYLESFTPKICCLESYWSTGMTDPLSVKPFIKAIGLMIEKEIVVAHGKPGGLKTSVKDIESEELIKAFNGLERYYNIVYFSGREILGGPEGKEFTRSFLEKTGTVAVVGYTEMNHWVDSMVIDTLFLSRFFEVNGNQFAQLQKIYDSVVRDYPRAERCGFSMFLNEKYL
jgi:hypothetical protein